MTAHVYSLGVLACSACVRADWDPDRVQAEVNSASPTFIRTPWTLDPSPDFRDGSANPHPCENDPDRVHWLFRC